MIDKEAITQKLTKLVKDFRANYSQHVKELESNTETKLVEKLFEILGWTSDDFEKTAHSRRDMKAGFPDYAFKIDQRIVFFVEVKKVGIPLEKEADKQVISYALSKGGIPFAISTNFETLKIFCVEQKDAINNIFRVFKKPEEYIENLQDLLYLHKENVEQNILLKKAMDEGRLKKRVTIDESLLEDLMTIRNLIANDIQKRYKGDYELNEREEIIQRIIDRLIFIRKCEDVGINLENLTLKEIRNNVQNKVYPKLKELFRLYNDIYNGGLFAIDADNDCDKIEIEGEIVQNLIDLLYWSKDGQYSYNFKVITADILGKVYEQYLGKILAQTKSGKSKLADGQAHRKEEGIYYTPTYAVDYIVANTLGIKLKDEKIEIGKIKVLDPACGSGSFLIKAFDYLFEYQETTDEKVKQHLIDDKGMYSVKTAILKENLYGVDLDLKAVEITKLNLFLKASENKRKLPDDAELHIRHGNSLIDDESVAGLNAFKWQGDYQKGTFDVVIGNPPYINMQTMPELQKYCEINYPEIYTGQNDILYYFVLRGLEVLKNQGRLGFIVSRYFLESSYATKFRKFILDNSAIERIIDFNNFQVFGRKVNVLTSIIILRSDDDFARKKNSVKIVKIKKWDENGLELMDHILQHQDVKVYSDEFIDVFEMNQKEFTEESWTLSNSMVTLLKKKIEKGTIPLGENHDVGKGMETGFNEAFVIEEKDALDEAIEPEVLRKYIKTMDLKRFVPLERNLQIIYIPEKISEDKIENALRHLDRWQMQLKERYDYKKKHCEWYSWGNLRNRELFEKNSQKIITPLYSTSNKFIYDSGSINQNYFTLTDTYIIVPKPQSGINLRYVIALLNSKLIEFYFKNSAKLKREGYYEYAKGSLSGLPIKYDKKFESEIVALTDRMLSLKEQLNKFKDKKTSDTARIDEELKKTDAEIDTLVYEIYGLTKEEIQIIEEFVS